jgi:hypothetical protein
MRYIRMTYNNNGWLKPAGCIGKSNNAQTHEFSFGFGYEEWFFNENKFKDEDKKDAHFGYLEPLKYNSVQDGEELILFTIRKNINGTTSRVIVAKILEHGWRMINHNRFLDLIAIPQNINRIGVMRNELNTTFGIIPPNFPDRTMCPHVVRNHALVVSFDNVKVGNNLNGLPDTRSQLFNIEIFKNKFEIINEELDPANINHQHYKIFRFNRFKPYIG